MFFLFDAEVEERVKVVVHGRGEETLGQTQTAKGLAFPQRLRDIYIYIYI